jgi:bacterioferritin-associated ferredoxin
MDVFRAELESRDWIEITESEGQYQLRASGCSELQQLLELFKSKYGPALKTWPLPGGVTHSELLLKEALQKMRGQFQFPYAHEEICHCRAVATRTVDQAILSGCHSLEALRKTTSANTACGTCHTEIELLLHFRLGGLCTEAQEV